MLINRYIFFFGTESIHTLKVKFKCLHPEMNTVTFVKTPTSYFLFIVAMQLGTDYYI